MLIEELLTMKGLIDSHICLILGGSASGKSSYAEALSLSLRAGAKEGTPLFYLATLENRGDPEMLVKIARHQSLRRGNGFETIECPRNLRGIFSVLESAPQRPVVLLDCLGNLVANEMFSEDPQAVNLYPDLLALAGVCEALILVGNLIFSDGQSYDEETNRYITGLAALQNQLASQAAQVTELVCGIPVQHAGRGRNII